MTLASLGTKMHQQSPYGILCRTEGCTEHQKYRNSNFFIEIWQEKVEAKAWPLLPEIKKLQQTSDYTKTTSLCRPISPISLKHIQKAHPPQLRGLKIRLRGYYSFEYLSRNKVHLQYTVDGGNLAPRRALNLLYFLRLSGGGARFPPSTVCARRNSCSPGP